MFKAFCTLIFGAFTGLISCWITSKLIDEMGVPARKKLLIGFSVGALAGGVLCAGVIIPHIDTQITQDIQGRRRRQVESFYESQPALVQLATTAPDYYSQLRSEMDPLIEAKKSEEEVASTLTAQLQQVSQQYLYTSDEDLVHTMTLYLRLMRPTRTFNQHVCREALMEPDTYETYLNKQLARDTATNDELNETIAHAVAMNHPKKSVDIEMARQDLGAIYGSMTTRAQLEVFDYIKDPTSTLPPDSSWCSFYFAYYDAIMQLPVDHAANLLRYGVSSTYQFDASIHGPILSNKRSSNIRMTKLFQTT